MIDIDSFTPTPRVARRAACRVQFGVLIAFVILAVLGASMSSASAAAAATTTPRIDLKVLLLGTSQTEPDYVAWQTALQREGVPYTSLIESSTTASGAGHTSIGLTSCTGTDPCQTLSDTASDGSPEAKYQAIIVATGNLAFSASDTSAIEQYEHEFNVRQITGESYPGLGYGMSAPTVSGALDGSATGTLTTDGQSVFPYLKATAPITMDTGTYGYEATPISPAARRRASTRSSAGPNGSALVGIYTDSHGVQDMVEIFNQNQYQLQAELLASRRARVGHARRVLRHPGQLPRDPHRRQLPRRRLVEHRRQRDDRRALDRLQPRRRAARGPR